MKLVVAGGALVCLLALWLVYSMFADPVAATEELDRDVVVEQEAEYAHQELAEQPVAKPILDSGSQGQEEREPVHQPLASEDEAEDEAEESAGLESIEIRVILVGEGGVEFERLDGELALLCWAGNRGTTNEFEVTAGSCQLDLSELEGVDAISVEDLRLDGRGAAPEDRGARYSLDTEVIVIRAKPTLVSSLSVVDAVSGVHLSGVTVVESEGWLADDVQHPGEYAESRVAIDNGVSPIELTPSTRAARSNNFVYFVHSDGYAWRQVHMDLVSGGEREVRLPAGGDLALEVLGECPSRAHLRLRQSGSPDSSPYIEIAVSGPGLTLITGLMPGSYTASVELGKWYDSPRSVGEALVIIEPGQRARFQLQVDAPEEVEGARLAGTVVVPQAWGLDSFTLLAEPVGESAGILRGELMLSRLDMRALAGREDSWGFDLGQQPIGTWEFTLSSGGYPTEVECKRTITLGPQGDENVRIELPPPARVVVHILDAVTGEPANVQSLHWSIATTEDGQGLSHSTVMRKEGQEGFDFRATTGEIQLGAFGGDYLSISEALQIREGLNEFTYNLEKNCPVHFNFTDGETPVPLPGRWYPSPEHLGGEGKLLFVSTGDFGFRLALSAPGDYRFEMPEFPDFEPIPDQVITVRRGEEIEHVVELKRKP